MKRSGPPARRQPMKRGRPLRRHKKGDTLRRDSARRRASTVGGAGISEAVAAIADRRAGGACEIVGCRRPADERHHRRMRSAGGRRYEIEYKELVRAGPGEASLDTWRARLAAVASLAAANLVELCGPHHRMIHGEPDWGYDTGLLIRRSSPMPTEPHDGRVDTWPERAARYLD